MVSELQSQIMFVAISLVIEQLKLSWQIRWFNRLTSVMRIDIFRRVDVCRYKQRRKKPERFKIFVPTDFDKLAEVVGRPKIPFQGSAGGAGVPGPVL